VIQKERKKNKRNVTKEELRQAKKTCEPGVSGMRERFGEDVSNHVMTGNPLKGEGFVYGGTSTGKKEGEVEMFCASVRGWVVKDIRCALIVNGNERGLGLGKVKE
jgi:hypothetical protein